MEALQERLLQELADLRPAQSKFAGVHSISSHLEALDAKLTE